MAQQTRTVPGEPALLDVVALLTDKPEENLTRGQVGTVVEALDDRTVLVEFSDERGAAYAVVSCAPPELIVLHYDPQAV